MYKYYEEADLNIQIAHQDVGTKVRSAALHTRKPQALKERLLRLIRAITPTRVTIAVLSIVAVHMVVRIAHASGERQISCAGNPIPSGWIIADVTYSNVCGSFPVQNAYVIERLDNQYNGSTTVVCLNQLPGIPNLPAGWERTSVFAASFHCGADTLSGFDPPNMQAILRVSGNPVPVRKPDLIVTNITWSPASPAPGQPVVFSATVKNQGDGGGPEGTHTTVTFSVDGIPATKSYNYTRAIQPGVSVILTADQAMPGNPGGAAWIATQGTHKILAFVDDGKLISESNEDNNYSSKDITVSSPTRGYLDIIDAKGIAKGWAQDPGASSQSLLVHFYVDGVAGQGTFVGAVLANIPRADVTPGDHGFAFSIPNQFRDGQPHRLYAYGLDATGDPPVLLTNSPKTFTANVLKKAVSDFDGDGRTDLAVFRPGANQWFALLTSNNALWGTTFGLSSDKLVPSDYDGDGRTDVAVFRSSEGNWYILDSLDGYRVVQFGQNGDKPVPGDYDGDGKTDLAVTRAEGVNLVWYILSLPTGTFSSTQFGLSTDIAVPGDYDGDGKTDIAVFRKSNNTWYILGSRDGYREVQFGNPRDVTAPADYDGDGKTDIAVFRPGNGVWCILGSRDGYREVQFGTSGDTPVPGDYDGDGKADTAVFRPSDGTWYMLLSSNGVFAATPFGTFGDIPLQPPFHL